MRCLEHLQVEAIGTCISCGRGLCERCQWRADSGELVCSEACRVKVHRRHDYVDLIAEEFSVKGEEYKLIHRFVRGISWACFLLGVAEVAGVVVSWAGLNLPRMINLLIWKCDLGLGIFLWVFSVLLLLVGRQLHKFACRCQEKAHRIRGQNGNSDCERHSRNSFSASAGDKM